MEFSAQGLIRLESRCQLIRKLWEESTSKPFQVVGRIQFFAVLGVRYLFSCWLLARDCTQLLEDTLKSIPYGFLHLQVSDKTLKPSHALKLWCRLLPCKYTCPTWGSFCSFIFPSAASNQVPASRYFVQILCGCGDFCGLVQAWLKYKYPWWFSWEKVLLSSYRWGRTARTFLRWFQPVS